MSAKTLMAVAFKVIGVYILLGIAMQLPITLGRTTTTTFDPPLLYWMLAWGIEAILAISLVLFGTVLARLLIGDSGEIQLSITPVELRWIGFAIVGLIILLTGIRTSARVALVL